MFGSRVSFDLIAFRDDCDSSFSAFFIVGGVNLTLVDGSTGIKVGSCGFTVSLPGHKPNSLSNEWRISCPQVWQKYCRQNLCIVVLVGLVMRWPAVLLKGSLLVRAIVGTAVVAVLFLVLVLEVVVVVDRCCLKCRLAAVVVVASSCLVLASLGFAKLVDVLALRVPHESRDES